MHFNADPTDVLGCEYEDLLHRLARSHVEVQELLRGKVELLSGFCDLYEHVRWRGRAKRAAQKVATLSSVLQTQSTHALLVSQIGSKLLYVCFS